MRYLMVIVTLLFSAAWSPLHAIDLLRPGPQFLAGVIKWVPSKIHEGGQDLALVIGAGRSEQAVRFWSGGKGESAELERHVGRQVGIAGVAHEYLGAWFIRPNKLSLARGSATAKAAPERGVPDRASAIASSWFLDRNKDSRLEPVVRVKGVEGSRVEVFAVGQSEDGRFSKGVNLLIDVDSGSVTPQED
jgi:hypothetical protein